jgi:hypothetical protein
MEKITWQVPEYPAYSRDARWYTIAGIVGAGLLLYAVLTGNFMFAFIIIMLTGISILSSYKAPAEIEFSIMEEGVKMGGLFYQWEKFNGYWIVENEVGFNLGLDLKNILMVDIYVPIKGPAPENVEKEVSQFLPKNQERKGEPISYYLGRKLKI